MLCGFLKDPSGAKQARFDWANSTIIVHKREEVGGKGELKGAKCNFKEDVKCEKK